MPDSAVAASSGPPLSAISAGDKMPTSRFSRFSTGRRRSLISAVFVETASTLSLTIFDLVAHNIGNRCVRWFAGGHSAHGNIAVRDHADRIRPISRLRPSQFNHITSRQSAIFAFKDVALLVPVFWIGFDQRDNRQYPALWAQREARSRRRYRC
jgi:hypothetical protein